MEALLSLAFDNLSSYEGPKIKKGLKQVEGLLAPICLSASRNATNGVNGVTPLSPTKKTKDGGGASISTDMGIGEDAQQASPPPLPKTLSELPDDPAFCEFFKLQEGFEWNIAQRLLDALDRLLSRGSDGQNDLLILSTLDLIQGVLLLHPPSKVLVAREKYMNLLLDLLEPVNCPAIQSATLLTLVVALIDTPQAARAFEALDGLLTVTSLFKSRSTSRDVKLKLVEFLYFYLMPEAPSIPRAAAAARDSVPAMLQRSPSKLARAFGGGGGGGGANGNGSPRKKKGGAGGGGGGGAEEEDVTRSTEEKQALLGNHLHNVEDLVRDLKTCTPFGGVVS